MRRCYTQVNACVACMTQRYRRVLGIDIGSCNFGIGIVSAPGSGMWLVHHELLRLDQDYFPERLHLIGLRLNELIDKYAITEIAYERPCVKGQIGADLNMVVGVVLFIAKSNNKEIHGYTPAAVKQTVTGAGKANKQQVEDNVRKRLELPITHLIKTDHESDAIAVALTHIDKCKGAQKRNGTKQAA